MFHSFKIKILLLDCKYLIVPKVFVSVNSILKQQKPYHYLVIIKDLVIFTQILFSVHYEIEELISIHPNKRVSPCRIKILCQTKFY